MAVLKYYKVDSDGKIKRLRSDCPNATCGAGVFVRRYLLFSSSCHLTFNSQMSNHVNRQYCGKCGMTYIRDAVRALTHYHHGIVLDQCVIFQQEAA